MQANYFLKSAEEYRIYVFLSVISNAVYFGNKRTKK